MGCWGPRVVGGFNPTHLKNILVNLDHFPKVRGENKMYWKPPTRNCIDWFVLIFTREKKNLYRKSVFCFPPNLQSVSFKKKTYHQPMVWLGALGPGGLDS